MRLFVIGLVGTAAVLALRDWTRLAVGLALAAADRPDLVTVAVLLVVGTVLTVAGLRRGES